MTYTEAATAFGVDRETVIRRARRRNWGKQAGNDGKPRIAVPVDLLPPMPFVIPVGIPANDRVAIQDIFPDSALAIAVKAFREIEAQLRTERDAALAEVLAERARTVSAEREGEAARIQAAVAEAEAKAAREAMAREVRRLEEAEASRLAAEATRDKALAAGRDAAMRAMALEAERSRIKPQAERVPTLEAELVSLREAQAREVRQLAQAEEALKTAETQRDAAQVARDATQAELSGWTAGGPLARAWRGFWRGR